MTFDELLARVLVVLQRDNRVSYRALKLRFDLDDDAIEALKDELIYAKRVAADDANRVLVWIGDASADFSSPPVLDPAARVYTPQHLTEKILASRSALEGERKHVTVLFADIKDSTELIRDLDPESAQQLLDPALHIMMDAVHRYEGTVNHVLGDGIMALFGAPVTHEDHALRACYAALAMQEALRSHADEVQRSHGMALQVRVGLNSGDVIVRTISTDLHMDYSAVGPTTHLAARMEQLARPGSILCTAATLRLVREAVQVSSRGLMTVKGLAEPIELFELVGARAHRGRMQMAVARGLTRFVGRHREMAIMAQALAQARAGQGQIVAVVGEAGVGKSRLAYECIHAPHTQGWRVVESAAVSYGQTTPYFAMIDMLKRAVALEEREEAQTIRAKVTEYVCTLDANLKETIPPLLALLDVLPDDSPFHQLDPRQRRQQIQQALQRLLLRESRERPLLVVVEDVHWADSETQAWLDSLVESLPHAPLLLLVNYRPGYQHAWGSTSYYTQIWLDPLPPESADELLEALLGNDPSVTPLKHHLIARTESNPFFLEESVRNFVESHVLRGEHGAYRLLTAIQEDDVPATVQTILAARIDRLLPDAKHLLQTAAVIGPKVSLPLLRAVTDLSADAVPQHLASLQEGAFLYETQLFPEQVYAFKHALTQQVASQLLLTRTRRQIHTRIVEVLRTQFPEMITVHPELLAHHATEAGLYEQALAYWRLAGERASARSAYVEAIAHLTKGLEVSATLPETPERIRHDLALHLALGTPLRATKGMGAPEVGQTYARARELCLQTTDSQELFAALSGLHRFYGGRAAHRTAYELGEQLLYLAQKHSDPLCLLEAHQALAYTLFFLGEFGSSRLHAEQGITLYDTQPCRPQASLSGLDAGVLCRRYAALSAWFLGYPDYARQRICEAIALAQELSHPFSLAFARISAVGIHERRGEWSAAQAQAEAGMALAAEQGYGQLLASGTISRGWVLVAQGQYEEGFAQIHQGLHAWRTTGIEVGLSHFLALLADAYGRAERLDEALRVVDEALALVERNDERYCEAELYRLQGDLLLRTANGEAHAPMTPEACFRRAIEIARRQHATSLELRAVVSLSRLWQQQNRRDAAHQMLHAMYEGFTEGFDTADMREARALLQTSV